MHDVLQVRGRSRDPLDPGGRAGERAVRRLGDGGLPVLALLEQVHQAQAVLGQQHAVGIERQHVVRVGHVQVAVGRVGGNQRHAANGPYRAVAAAHQADIAVQVHGLVGLVRERDVALALEAGELGPEDPDQPPVQSAQVHELEHDVLGRGLVQRPGDRLEVGREPQRDLVAEERVGVVGLVHAADQAPQPGHGGLVVPGKLAHRGQAWALAALGGGLESVERGREVSGGPGQHFLDLGRQLPGSVQQVVCPPAARLDRVVDEQHHADVRVLLQRGRQQRVADHVVLLLVGRHDGGQRWCPVLEELVEYRAPGPVMAAGPVEEAKPAEQVGKRRRGQHRDDQQVDDRLRPVHGARVVVVEEVLEQPADEVADPCGDRDDDRQPCHRDPALADRLRHHGHRLGSAVMPPLPARPRRARPGGGARHPGRRPAGLLPARRPLAIRRRVRQPARPPLRQCARARCWHPIPSPGNAKADLRPRQRPPA